MGEECKDTHADRMQDDRVVAVEQGLNTEYAGGVDNKSASGFGCSVLALAVVIDGGGFDLGAAHEKAGVAVRSREGSSREGKEVHSVAVDAHEASVVEEDGAEPESSSGSHDRAGTIHTNNLAAVLSVEGEGVLFHFS